MPAKNYDEFEYIARRIQDNYLLQKYLSLIHICLRIHRQGGSAMLLPNALYLAQSLPATRRFPILDGSMRVQ